MNTIEYGQGAVNNTIGWGQGAKVGGSSFSNLKSIALDGVDDFVDCGDTNDFSFTTGSSDLPFSVSFWVKLNSTSGFDAFVSKDAGGSNREWTIGTFTNLRRVRFFLKNQGGSSQQSIEGNIPLTVGQWNNVVCTYDGRGGSTAYQGLNIYIDGVLTTVSATVSQTYSHMSNTSAPLAIGSYASSAYLQGGMDEVAIFSSELSQSDVTAIYGTGVPTSLSSYSSLISWWRCGDGDTAPTLTDNKGSNNGTMTNFSTFSTDVPT